MKLVYDGNYWLARQGVWYGIGPTRAAAALDCVIACGEALTIGLEQVWIVLKRELYRWRQEVFLAKENDEQVA